jgi:hypothetical protein
MDKPDDLQQKLKQRPQSVAFRRQVGRWILLPLVLGLLVLGLIIALFSANQVGSFSAWADVSLIFLLIPVCLSGLLVLAVLAGLVYLFIMIITWIPQPAYQIELALRRVDRAVQRVSRVVSRPFMFPSAIAAAFTQVFRSIASIFQQSD